MNIRIRWPIFIVGVFVSAWLLVSARSYAATSGRSALSALHGDDVATSVFLPSIVKAGVSAPTVQLTQIAETNRATDLKNAGDGRLFIVEQAGRIQIYDGTQVLVTPFLEITDRVDDGGSEMGLLGLAFHPDYAENGYFFVNYTTSVNGKRQTRVSRFSVDERNTNLADVTSEQVVLLFDQPFSNHNGGAIEFGPDGYLYVAVGDGGGSNDPDEHSQSSNSILGKMLRLDLDGTSGNLPDCDQSGNNQYRIPAGNPFADGAGGACDEIWALGLRNPWRFSFDAVTDDLWIADVGQWAWEEVDFEPAGTPGGRNYGWDCYEGNHPNSNDPAPACTGDRADYEFPVHEYGHSDGRCSITGGYVYRGDAHKDLQGHYLFADYCTGELWSLSGPPLAPTLAELTPAGNPLSSPRTFGQDIAGEIYVADNDAVYRLEEDVMKR